MKLSTLFILLILSIYVSAQEKGKIGISYTFGEDASVIQLQDIDGGASKSITNFSSVGVAYLKPLQKWLELETGLNYSLYTLEISPAPMINGTTSYHTLSLIDIPVGVRATFLKYFYVNGGLLLDMDMNTDGGIDSQTGIGVQFGLGAKYDFKFGGSVFIQPSIKWHSLLPFSTQNYHESILESGWKIGVTYKI